MRQIKKLFSKKIFGLLVLIPLIAASCGGGSSSGGGTKKSGPVELTMWKPFAETVQLRKLINAYQQANKNVRITLVEPPETNYEGALIDALASGSGPDIFSINNAWLPQYIDKIEPAPESVWRFVDFRNDFVNVVTDDFTQDNKIYGAALSVDSLALYYNKTLLPASGVYTVPKTWAELEVAARKINQQDGNGFFRQSGIALGLSSQAIGGQVNRAEDIMYLFMLQRGAVSWSKDLSAPTFGDSTRRGDTLADPAVEALEFYTSFANPRDENYNWNTGSDYSIDAFVNRRAAMMFGYSYARELILQKNGTLDFGVDPVPQPSLGEQPVNFANYWGEVVSKQSKNAAAAWDFLKFITSKDRLTEYYKTVKVPSSRKDLIPDQISDPELGVFADAGSTAKSFRRPQALQVDAIFSQMIDSVTLRGTAPGNAVRQAMNQASSLSRSRR